MGFIFIYEPSEYQRIIPAVTIDARATIPAIKNEIGAVIKAYTDVEVNKAAASEVIFFRIETIANKGQPADGVLAGYFSLYVRSFWSSAVLYQFLLRPNFKQNTTQISAEISQFILNSQWKQYFL